MNAIVLNTLSGAVTEHDLPFSSVSAGYAASAAGLFAIGGDSDNGAKIAARAVLPITDSGSMKRKSMGDVVMAVQGPAGSFCEALVRTMTLDDNEVEVVEEYAYQAAIRASHVARAIPGAGIRANRLGLGFQNVNGAHFRLTAIEADVYESKGRRLA